MSVLSGCKINYRYLKICHCYISASEESSTQFCLFFNFLAPYHRIFNSLVSIIYSSIYLTDYKQQLTAVDHIVIFPPFPFHVFSPLFFIFSLNLMKSYPRSNQVCFLKNIFEIYISFCAVQINPTSYD